jgi:hypothetical protein
MSLAKDVIVRDVPLDVIAISPQIESLQVVHFEIGSGLSIPRSDEKLERRFSLRNFRYHSSLVTAKSRKVNDVQSGSLPGVLHAHGKFPDLFAHIHAYPSALIYLHGPKLSLPLFVSDCGVDKSTSQGSYFDPQFDLVYISDEIKPKELKAPFRKPFQAARFMFLSCSVFGCFALGLTILHSQVPRSIDVSEALKSGFLGLTFIFIGGAFIWTILQTFLVAEAKPIPHFSIPRFHRTALTPRQSITQSPARNSIRASTGFPKCKWYEPKV